jgi:predicted GIY-YIG superfamily endonuclease
VKSGIYQIKNLINDQIYIGSTNNFRKRWSEHKSGLNNKNHRNSHLQRSWNKYGSEVFEFSILEEVEIHSLLEKEQYWIDTLKPVFNKAKVAGTSQGIVRSEETRLKQRLAKLGTKRGPRTQEHKDNLRLAQKNHPCKSLKATNEITGEVIYFDSISLVKTKGFVRSSVYYALKLGRTYRGLVWKYNNGE